MDDRQARRIERLTSQPLFPFTGDLALRELSPPMDAEPPRSGESDDRPCFRCSENGSPILWRNDRFVISATPGGPNPVGLFVETVDCIDFDCGDDPVCGDEIVTPPETCDPPGSPASAHRAAWSYAAPSAENEPSPSTRTTGSPIAVSLAMTCIRSCAAESVAEATPASAPQSRARRLRVVMVLTSPGARRGRRRRR